MPAGAIRDAIKECQETLFVLDEAYSDLLPEPQWTRGLLDAGNLIVLRSMTKAWGLAGLRVGCALAGEVLAGALRAAKPPWNVNACAQAAGEAALADLDHYHRTVEMLGNEKQRLMQAVRSLGFPIIPSMAAFFLVEVGDARLARQSLLKHGCLVRDCSSFGLPEYIRISPRRPEQNARLLDALATTELARTTLSKTGRL